MKIKLYPKIGQFLFEFELAHTFAKVFQAVDECSGGRGGGKALEMALSIDWSINYSCLDYNHYNHI